MAIDPTTPILIVDDYQAMIRIIRNFLLQLGFEQIDEAHDGQTALAKLKERPYGLVISDWNMAPMNGLELLQQVRADPGLKNLPFIMVTAENRDDRIALARQAGVSGYVIKPFNVETLGRRIATLIGA
ncbi:MAG TPA: response regulator [Geminicoccaceae bacterium]|jgi:two-component system, chemotaxis family, chemotaxis protein CheY|nr:response regulator [Geminicoccaceae bacterium]